MTRVLIVGGAGAFGFRLAQRLIKTPDVDLVLTGRNLAKAEHAAKALENGSGRAITATALNSKTATPDQLKTLAPSITINASGPFQEDDYTLARAAIDARSHYIDLADARDFVVNIRDLNDDANHAGVLVISGASTVPGVSSVVLAHLARSIHVVEHVEIGISPGNHFDPGPATTRSVLKSLGQPIPVRYEAKPTHVYGWQDLRRESFGSLGKRWQSNVDVPDLSLIPEHYPNISTVRVQAGVEVGLQHLGLWLLSWCARIGLPKHPDLMTHKLLALRQLTRRMGSDTGGMRVLVSGKDRHNQPITKLWTLVARDGHGPYIPTLASIILTKALLAGTLRKTGAYPCFDLFSYEAFLEETLDLSITCTISDAVR